MRLFAMVLCAVRVRDGVLQVDHLVMKRAGTKEDAERIAYAEAHRRWPGAEGWDEPLCKVLSVEVSDSRSNPGERVYAVSGIVMFDFGPGGSTSSRCRRSAMIVKAADIEQAVLRSERILREFYPPQGIQTDYHVNLLELTLADRPSPRIPLC